MQKRRVVVAFAAVIGRRPWRALWMILAGGAFALEGCQAVLGIDPDSRHESAFCNAAAAYDSRCNVNDACDVAKLANCTNNEAIASPGAIAAYVACADLAPCGGTDAALEIDAGSAYIDCLAAHFGAPSTLLTGLVESYCAQCGAQDIQACTVGPVAQSIATLDDPILTEIRGTCLANTSQTDDGGISESCTNFSRCMNDVVNAADPPPAECNGN